MARNQKDLLIQKLFSNKSAVLNSLSPAELETRARWMYIMTKKLEEPLISNKKILDMLMYGIRDSWKGVSQSTAYNDIAAVNEILGNVKTASKAWIRYTIIEGCKRAYEIAEEKEDPQGMAAALDKMGKYSRADKEDDALDYTQMLPPVFEPTDDVTVIEGIRAIPDLEKRRAELRALHKGTTLSDYAETIEIDDNTDLYFTGDNIGR